MSEIKPEVKIIQPLEISETEGFEQDKLDRGDFGETLARILENQPGGNVFALDAGWGQGKTTFIKMWRGHVGHIRENKLQTIYFDAFANDYQKDILRVLTTRILGTIGKGNFFIRRSIKKVMKLAAVIAKSRFISSGFELDFSSIPGWVKKTVKSFWEVIPGSSIFTRVIEKVAPAELRKAMQSKSASGGEEKFQEAEKLMMDFKEELGKLTKTEKSGPIIFIVDELDRCRPDFALDLLETIKHFFDVPGIVFLLVMNHEALNDMIRTRYGTVDGKRYMQKFVQYWLTLPEPDIENYAQSICEESSKSHSYAYKLIGEGNPNLREVQEIYGYEKLINSLTVGQSLEWRTSIYRYDKSVDSSEGNNWEHLIQSAISLVCYIKVMKSEFLPEILLMTDEEILSFEWKSILNFIPVGLPVCNDIFEVRGRKEGNIFGGITGKERATATLIKDCAEILITLRKNFDTPQEYAGPIPDIFSADDE